MKYKIILFIGILILLSTFVSALTLPSFINNTNIVLGMTMNNTINNSGFVINASLFSEGVEVCNVTNGGICGTYVSGATSLTNASISFNGIDEYIAVGNRTTFSTVCDNGCSFSLWMEINLNPSIETTVFGRYDATNTDFFFRMRLRPTPEGMLRFIINNGTTTNIPFSEAAYNVTNRSGEVIHVVNTFNGSTSQLGVSKMYINGLLVNISSNKTAIDAVAWADPEQFFIGTRDETGIKPTFNGSIDEIFILNTTLTSSQILELYKSYIPLEINSNITSYTKVNNNFDVNITLINFDETATCTVFDNSSDIFCSIDTDVTLAENQTTITCTILNDIEEPVLFTPNCNTTIDNINGTSQSIFVDGIAPTLTVNFPDPDGSTIVQNNTEFTFNISAADNNLFGFEINCTQAGTETFSFTKENINQPTFDFINTTTISTPGLQECTVNISDDHTGEIIEFENEITNTRWFFGLLPRDIKKLDRIEGYVGELDFVINKSDIASLDAEIIYKTDRYSLYITFDNPTREIKYIPIYITCPLPYKAYKRSTNPKYKEHWVCSKGIEGYWIDGNTDDDDIVSSEYDQITGVITFNYQTRNNYLNMDSIGGLNFNSTTFNFTVGFSENLTFSAFNFWNKTNLNVFSINATNSSDSVTELSTTTGIISTSLMNDTYSLLFIQNEYDFNDLPSTYISGVSPSDYNTSVWQTNLTVNVRENVNLGLLALSSITVNDSTTTNTTTSATGSTLFKTNNNTLYTITASKDTYTLNSTTISITTETSVSQNIFLTPLINITFNIFDQLTGNTIPTEVFTINLFNEDLGNAESNSSNTSIITFHNISGGEYRITMTSTNFEDIILFETMETPDDYIISLFTVNSSNTNLVTVTLHVTDEVNENIEGANIKVFVQDQTTGLFNEVFDKFTDINGEVVVSLVSGTEWYKFTIFSGTTKCHESTNPFTISPLATDFFFTCVVSNDYLAIRNVQDNINFTPITFTNTSNITGTFNTQATAGGTTEFCLTTFIADFNNDTQIGQTCQNSTSFLTNVAVSVSGRNKDVIVKGILTAKPLKNNITITLDSLNYKFIITSAPEFSIMGIFIVFIVIILVFFVFIKTPQVAIVISGAVFMILSWTPLMKIQNLSSTATGLGGSGIFILCIIIAYVVSKNTKE